MSFTLADEPRLVFPASGRARAPFRRGVNHVMVDATDESGGRYVFAIDTGASYSVVTPGFVAGIRSEASPKCAPMAARGAFGAIAAAPELHEIIGLRIGGLLIERAGMLSMDLAPVSRRLGFEVHGIIGYNILSRLVTLVDYAAGEVTFISSEDPEPLMGLGEPLHLVPFSLLSGAMIEVRGSVNGGKPWPFLVDLGAQISLLTPEAVEKAGIPVDPVPAQLPTMGLGSQGEGSGFRRAIVSNLRFGSLAFEGTPLFRVDLPVFATLGYAGRPAGILGNDLMGHYRVAIDYKRSVLRFWKP
jgi:predicted aspartyl protease